MTSQRHHGTREVRQATERCGWKHSFASPRSAGILVPWTIVLLMLVPPGAHAEPPQLTARKAADLSARAISEYGLSPRITKRDCRRRSRLVFTCLVRWTDGGDRFTATVRIARGGTETSPVDTFALSGRKRDQFDGTTQIRSSGRFVVETRRAFFGRTLRLWIDDRGQIDVTVGDPETVIPTDSDDAPPQGSSWVVLPITVENTGRDRWENTSYMLDLLNVDGATMPLSSDAARAKGCADIASAASGEVRTGCIGFEVPTADVAGVAAQWDVGNETGVWGPLERQRRPPPA